MCFSSALFATRMFARCCPIETLLLFSQTTHSSLWLLGFPVGVKDSNWCLLVARFVLLSLAAWRQLLQ